MKLLKCVAVCLVAAASSVVAQDKPAGSTGTEDRMKVVNCFDAGRNLVRRIPLWKCKGDVVSDARVEEIRLERIQRAKGRMTPAKSLFPGLKMVSSGTGFFVSNQGHVLTNDHVVAGCTALSAKPTRERDHRPASFVGTDKPDDLAVIRYSGAPPGIAAFRKPIHLDIGDKIAVVGHPLHGRVAIKPVFVTGKVRLFEPEKLRQWGRFAIDADIRRGNSGGPVMDDRGYIVGVVSAKINTPAMFQRTGEVMRDIGLIIRQDRALRFLERYNVAYAGGETRSRLDDKKLFALASTFVVRIGCWR